MIENPRLPYLKEKVAKLSLRPGVYLMKDKTGKIIYVGKAKSLKKRMSSYFRNNAQHDEKVRKMVAQVYDFDFIVTDSEFEALVLECSLIKLHNPKYNILLKDDKGYHYVHISKEDYPRITAVKTKQDDGGEYIGPYISSFWVKQAVDEANKVFRLPTCNRKFPQDFRKGRPCLNFHIKQCVGVCRGRIPKQEYQDTVKEAVHYMKNGSADSVKALTVQMEEAAERLDFERAAKLRDRIGAIQKLAMSQKIIRSSKDKDQDIIAFSASANAVCAAVLKFRAGRLVDKENFVFHDYRNVAEVRREFLPQYYSGNLDIPRRVLLDAETEDRELLEEFLSKQAERVIKIVVPQRGESKKLVDMAYKNAAEQLSQKLNYAAKELTALEELGKLLGLEHPPEYIESYDISNLGDSGIVAGMVVFENAKPLRSAYKRFSMKETLTQDDYACMKEVITRRFKRYFEEKETGKGFGRMPDLILLDGGKGHVSVVLEALGELGVAVPVFGMVKDDRHRTRAIAKDGGEIAIASYRSAFRLVATIQEEVHRFSISYQKNVRKKTTFSMRLTQIPGIGPKKAHAILKTFKTKAKLKEATPEELSKAAKVPLAKAEEIYRQLRDF